jgi:hypothetical protein
MSTERKKKKSYIETLPYRSPLTHGRDIEGARMFIMADENDQPKSEFNNKHIGPGSVGLGIVSYIKDLFEAFKTSRLPFEELWEECWYNFLGEYQPHLNLKPKTEGTPGKSKAFLKLTALKCNTAHSKLVDVIFGQGKSAAPFCLEPVDFERMGISPDQAKEIMGRAKHRIDELMGISEFQEVVSKGVLEMTILGTAVLKGPIADIKTEKRTIVRTVGGFPLYDLNMAAAPYETVAVDRVIPVFDHVPLWEYYTDINAKSNSEAIGEIHFQRMLPARFKAMAASSRFIRENVMEAARRRTAADANDKRYIQLADNYMGTQGEKDERISVLEFWGLTPVPMLEEAGCEMPEGVTEEDSIEAHIILAADGIPVLIEANLLGRRPFLVCPYKSRPHVIYGVGVAEAMRDSQKIANSALRMIIDNKALSGNGMIAVNIDKIDQRRTKNLEVYTGKTWYVKGNASPREAIDSVTFQDVTMGLRELLEMMERFSDEETSIPKYTSGTQDKFLNKTATGMSMLMTQANINLKTVVQNIDDYWIEPGVTALYDWITNIHPDEGGVPAAPIMKVSATGTNSLIAKEIKLENIAKFVQLTAANSQDAMMTDRHKLIRTYADLLDLSDIMRTPEEVDQLLKTLNDMNDPTNKDMREFVDLDKLYGLLTRYEQVQVLRQLGIQPDPNIPQNANALNSAITGAYAPQNVIGQQNKGGAPAQ